MKYSTADISRMTGVVRRDLPGIAEAVVWTPGISCQTCGHPGVSESYCNACGTHEALRIEQGGFADKVVPLSYAWRGTQIWHDIYNYKKDLEAIAAPGRMRLQKLGWWGTNIHGRCVEESPGIELNTRFITVPSTQGRSGTHPIEAIARLLPDSWERSVAIAARPSGRMYNPSTFALEDPASVRDSHVIVFDDTWATGARAQSLATTVRSAGAAYITILVLANHLDPAKWEPLAEYRRTTRPLPWSVDRCPVHGVVCVATIDT